MYIRMCKVILCGTAGSQCMLDKCLTYVRTYVCTYSNPNILRHLCLYPFKFFVCTYTRETLLFTMLLLMGIYQHWISSLTCEAVIHVSLTWFVFANDHTTVVWLIIPVQAGYNALMLFAACMTEVDFAVHRDIVITLIERSGVYAVGKKVTTLVTPLQYCQSFHTNN